MSPNQLRGRPQRWLPLLVLLALALLAMSVGAETPAHAQSAPPTTTPPGTAPSTTVPGAATPPPAQEGRCDGLSFPVSAVCQVTVGQLPTLSPFALAMRGAAAVVAEAASYFLEKVGASITAQTSPQLSLPWFTNSYGATLTVGLLLITMFTLLGVMQCVIRGAGAEMGRIVLIYVPSAVVLMFLAPSLTALLLRLFDDFTNLVTQDAAENIKTATHNVTAALANLTATAPPPHTNLPIGVGMFLAFLIVVGSVVVWLELLLRDAAVYAVTLLVPLGMAAMTWPAIRHWCRRIIDVLVAVIVSKFIVVTIVDMAAAGLATTKVADVFATLGSCVTLLILAAFTPVALLKLVPIAGAELGAALHLRPGLTQAAATTGALHATTMARHALMTNVRGAGAAAAARGAAGPVAAAAATARSLGWGSGGPPPSSPPSPPSPRPVPPRPERE